MPDLKLKMVLVADLLKDEYNFEFLRGSNFKERELEDHLAPLRKLCLIPLLINREIRHFWQMLN